MNSIFRKNKRFQFVGNVFQDGTIPSENSVIQITKKAKSKIHYAMNDGTGPEHQTLFFTLDSEMAQNLKPLN
jgi:hypothetical protein